MIKFEATKLHSDAKLPVRSTAKSAGYDFFAAEDVIIPSYKKLMKGLNGYLATEIPYPLADLKNITKQTGLRPTLVTTGVKCIMENNMYLSIYSRSSVPLNDWLILANGVGIIDSEYRGQLGVLYDNLSDSDYQIKAGDRVAQMLVMPSYKFKANVVDILPASDRGEGGFGSTGK